MHLPDSFWSVPARTFGSGTTVGDAQHLGPAVPRDDYLFGALFLCFFASLTLSIRLFNGTKRFDDSAGRPTSLTIGDRRLPIFFLRAMLKLSYSIQLLFAYPRCDADGSSRFIPPGNLVSRRVVAQRKGLQSS